MFKYIKGVRIVARKILILVILVIPLQYDNDNDVLLGLFPRTLLLRPRRLHLPNHQSGPLSLSQ